MFEVPVLRSADLWTFLLNEIERAIVGRKHGPFNEVEWGNIFGFVIAPLFRTPRDVRRYTNSIPVALSVVGQEIALADLLAIEPAPWFTSELAQRAHAVLGRFATVRGAPVSGAAAAPKEDVGG
jgi:hypothetical protein